MEDMIAAIIGVVTLIGFAGGLVWQIGAPPLLIITIVVLVMAVIDVVHTLRQQAEDAEGR